MSATATAEPLVNLPRGTVLMCPRHDLYWVYVRRSDEVHLLKSEQTGHTTAWTDRELSDRMQRGVIVVERRAPGMEATR